LPEPSPPTRSAIRTPHRAPARATTNPPFRRDRHEPDHPPDRRLGQRGRSPPRGRRRHHHRHRAVRAAAKTDTTDPAGITTGLTADGGQGAAIQNPVTGQQTGYNQQITTQAGGGYVAVGMVAILVLGVIVFFKVKHGHIKAFDAVLVSLLGISLAGTVVGTMGHQMTNSLFGSLGGVLGGL
jgi:hypothetical protein